MPIKNQSQQTLLLAKHRVHKTVDGITRKAWNQRLIHDKLLYLHLNHIYEVKNAMIDILRSNIRIIFLLYAFYGDINNHRYVIVKTYRTT